MDFFTQVSNLILQSTIRKEKQKNATTETPL